MLNVQLVGDRELLQKLDAMPSSVQAMLVRKVTKLAINLRDHVKSDKLEGQVLNHKSGALSRSIQDEVDENDLAVYGRVFSAGDVKYARIHEYGGTIPAHDIVPNKAEALAFMIGGKQVFAKIVHMPAVNMPERSFLRSSLADMAANISMELKQAVIDGLRGPLAA